MRRPPKRRFGWLSVMLAVVCGASADSVVTFNEIMYHPATNEASLEYVELYNQLCYDMDISGWRIRGGIDYDFADGTIIPGTSCLVVAASPAALKAETGYTNAYGPFTDRLANNGEALRLLNNSGRLMDEVNYGDGGDWPAAPDGSGVSLVKTDPESASASPENWSWSAQKGGSPGTTNTVNLSNGVAFNEVASSVTTPFWVELVNSSTGSVNLTGYTLACAGVVTGKYVFPSRIINPGNYVVVDESALGFHPSDEDKLFLYRADSNTVVDAAVVKIYHRGRYPEGTGRWLYPDMVTTGAVNSFAFHDEIVINEIMYHRQAQLEPYQESPEEWIELYNRGSTNVDLTGWKLEEGVEYAFEPGAKIAAGQYLVVAGDVNNVRTVYPALTNIVGNFSRDLSNKGELIRLVDANKNPADEVRYYAGGYWPQDADGLGASMELRDPRSDNSKAGAWAASDEAIKSAWTNYSYRGIAATVTGEPTAWHEFVMGMLVGPAEVLLDNISVVENPDGAADELIQNGGFDDGAEHWRFLGNHQRSFVTNDAGNPVLHLVASGATEYQGNQVETTFVNNRAIVNGNEYEISFRAKWLSGGRKLNTRIFFQRVAQTTNLKVPEQSGTPGARNSCYTTNIGPTYDGLVHSPAVPAAFGSITVTVHADDPDGVKTVTIWHRADGDSWSSAAMTPTGGGVYTGVLPGKSAGTVVQFYVQGEDNLGAVTYYPPNGPESRALVKVEDGAADRSGLSNFRIVMLASDASYLHTATNTLSNEMLDCTIVHNEQKVFYDAGVRLKGSFVGRNVPRVGFMVNFRPEQLFRGVHDEVAVDRSTGVTLGTVDEILIKHMASRAGDIPNMYDDLGWCMTPNQLSAVNTRATLRMAGFDDIYLDSQFDNGSDGSVFEFEVFRWHGSTIDGNPESLKNPNDRNPYSNVDIQDLGDSKENYRWLFLRSNNRDKDDYDPLMAFAKSLSLTGSALDLASRQSMDIQSCMRTLAFWALVGPADTYYVGQNAHNVRLYARPDNGKVLFMPWDWDFVFSQSTTSPLIGGWNIAKVVNLPGNLRLYYGHMRDIVNTTFNGTYMSRWTTHYGNVAGQDFSGRLSYIQSRAAYVLSQLPAAQVPFEITNANFSVDADYAVIGGNGWIDFKEIYIEGVPDPLDLTVTSTGSGTATRFYWQATVPLDPGMNQVTLLACDFHGNVVTSDYIEVISTVAERPLRDNLRVTELMYNPVDGSDYEFIEVCNTGTNTLDISKVVISDGVDFDFANSPITNLAAGAYIVVVGDLVAFSSKYNTNGMNIAGEFTGSLDNGGEHVSIQGQWYSKVLEFTYSDGGNWPLAADGAGHSLIPLIMASQTNTLLDYWATWRASTYIGGSPGQADPAPVATNIVINEVMAHTQNEVPPLYSDDWVELFNTTAATFNFGSTNWYLSDSSDNLRKWRIPSSNSIASRGWTVFTEVNHFHSLVTNGFGLDKLGEELYLSYLPGGGVDRVVDCIRFGGQAADASYGRYSDGQEYWYKMAPTPRAANQLLATQEVVISELMYHPAPTAVNPENNQNDEYVEIYNPNSVAIMLMNPGPDDAGVWRLDGEVEYDFPTNTVIPARGYIAVVSFNPTNTAAKNAFLAAYGQTNGQATILGPYSGQLDNQAGEVKVQRPIAPDLPGENWSWYTMDAVEYFDQAPWPTTADGTGKPLQRRPGRGTGLCPTNWVAGLAPTPGLAPAKVAITNPVYNTGYLVPFSAVVDATVDPDALEGAVQKVEFFDGANSLNVDTSPPYGFTLSGMTTPGNHMLYAKLTDDAGVNTSPGVLIVVYTNVPGSDAGKNQTMNTTVVDEVTLDATLAYNGIPTQEVTTSWTMTSGPGTASFGNASSLDTTVSFSTVGTYLLRLQTVYGAFVSNDYVTITVVDTNTLNQIPYQESFESYVSGARIGGINGWYSTETDAAVVKATNYTYSGSYPIGGQHTLALLVDGNVSNKFHNTASASNVWIDMIVEGRHWVETTEPDVGPDSQFAVYVKSNGHLMVWNCRTNPPPMTNVWTELPGTSVASNEIVRLTIQGSYTRDAGGFFKFRLWLNGVAVTTPSTWFTAANTNRNWLSDVTMQGVFLMDDLVVDRQDVLNWRTIIASVLSGSGAITPVGSVSVPVGGSTNFVMVASNWYHVASILVDGVDVGAVTNYSFTGVDANHTIQARFGADLAASNTPKWWLAQHGYNTNAFDSAARSDTDSDGLYAWEEYTAGTLPTNAASVFEVFIAKTGGQVVVTCPTIQAGPDYDGQTRYYAIQNSTNLFTRLWTDLAGATNIVGGGQTIVHTNLSSTNKPSYYRGRVYLK